MPAETTHHVGGTKHFECRVKGHPRPKVRWYKDGKEITHISRYQFDHSQEGLVSMVIPNISHDDEGHYRCRAENSEGIASTSAYLLVRGHKEHPEEAATSVHAMQIEEAVLFTDQEKAARKESRVKTSDSHIIEEVNGDFQKKRKLVLEVEEVVQKSSKVSSVTTTSTKTSSSTSSSTKKTYKDSPEEESTKISVDMLEKSYHSSDESTDDAGSVRLRAVSEKSDRSVKEPPEDSFSDNGSSLLMRQTKRLFSHDYGEGADLFQVETSSMMEATSVKTSISTTKTTVSTSESVVEETSTSTAMSASKKTSVKSEELNELPDVARITSTSTSARSADSAENGEVSTETSTFSTSQTRSSASGVTKVESSTSQSVTQVIENVMESRTDSRSSRSLLETSTSSERGSTRSAREELEYDISSLTQHDSGFLDSSKSDDLQKLSFTADVSDSAGSVQATRLKAETEVEGAAVEAEDSVRKFYIATEAGEKSPKVSEEEHHLLMTASVETESKKVTRDEDEAETESATESDTGSVGSVVGVDVDLKTAQSQKLRKQESKEKDDTEEEAKLAALATAGSRLAEKTGLRGSRTVEAEDLVDDKGKVGLLGRKKSDTDEDGRVDKKQTGEKTSKDEERTEFDEGKVDFDVKKQFDTDDENKSDKIQEVDLEKSVAKQNVDKAGDGKFNDHDDVSKREVDSSNIDSADGVRKRRSRAERDVDKFKDDEINEEQTVEQTGSWIKKVEEEKDKDKEEQKEIEDATFKGGDREEEVLFLEPKILHKMEDTSVESGNTLKLRTQVTASPRPDVTWSKDGKVLREGGRITLVTEDDVYSLEIEELRESDAGTYRLTAVNSLGEVFSDVTVSVVSAVPSSLAPGDRELSLTATVGVPQFLIQPQDVSVAESETIKLTCKVAGDPAPKISWEKDGQVVRSNRRVRVYESRGLYSLEIYDCEADDAGEYLCIAVNSRGQVTASVNVIIEGVERVMSVSEPAEPEGELASPAEEAVVGATGGAAESSDVCSGSDTRTVRYLKLIGMAAAFSLAALGIKKVMDNLTQ